MSYAVMPYAIELDGLRAFGSYGQEFVDEVVRQASSYDLNSLADMLSNADLPDLTPQDVLRQLLRGEPMNDRIGYIYGYALKLVCEQYGRALSNDGWWGMRWGWFDMVREALAEIGVRFDPSELVIGGAPVAMPHPDDFPCIGSHDLDDITSLAAMLDKADLDRLTDDSVREAVDQIREWLRICQENKLGLICFYH